MSEVSTQILRLAGPMQGWHTHTGRRYEKASHPSTLGSVLPRKASLVGLLGAALGRPRDADFSDLDALTMVLRIDQPGHREGELRSKRQLTSTGKLGSVGYSDTYLHDAVLVAGISGPTEQIREIRAALLSPVYEPYLGKKSCPPAQPFVRRMEAGDAETVLRPWRWEAARHWQARMPDPVSLRMVELWWPGRYDGSGLQNERALPPVRVSNPLGRPGEPEWLSELR